MSTDISNITSKGFITLLNKKVSESTISKYLAKSPSVIFYTVNPTTGHLRYLLREFPLGSKYKIDYVTLLCASGGWTVNFIELEPCHSTIFNKDRTPTRTLSIALRQINDWRDYIDNNPKELKETLFEWIKKKDLFKQSDPISRRSYKYYNILNPGAIISKNFKVIIGRRKNDNPSWVDPRARYLASNGVEIISYDRLLEFVKRRESIE